MVEVVVIGAGQAGLSAGWNLLRKGAAPGEDFVILDANEGPGGAWRHRWPSLTLGVAHGIHDLPGFPQSPADPSEPASSVVARYYGAYEAEFGLPVLRPWRVESVADAPDGVRVRVTSAHAVTGEKRVDDARAVINATGTWDQPYWPYYPGSESFHNRQLHTRDFTDAADFVGQRVLVVGGGASAVQFLLPLADAGATTIWSTRRAPVFGRRVFDREWGRDVERAVEARTEQGLPTLPVVATTGLPLTPEYQRGIDAGILVSRGPLKRLTERGVVFAGVASDQAGDLMPAWSGGPVDVDVIVWATGFRPAIRHLAPLRLRTPEGGLKVHRTQLVNDPRIFVAGYGAGASTIGATRTGRQAAVAAWRFVADGSGVETLVE